MKPAGDELAVLEVEVLGAPKRAQLILRQGTERQHVIRTTPEGRAVARGIVPGEYRATIQRAGRKATPPRQIAITKGRTRLVVGPTDAL